MYLSRYLFTNSNGNYYLRIRTPQKLKSVIGLTEIKRSLKTSNLALATKRALPLLDFIARLTTTMEIKKIFEQGGLGLTVKKIRVGNVEIEDLEIDPEKKGDVEAAVAFLQGIIDGEEGNVATTIDSKVLDKKNDPLKLVIEKYLAQKARAGRKWKEKTRLENVQIYNQLLLILDEDISVAQLDHEKARYVKDIILNLPPNINKIAKYKNKTFDEIVKMGDKPISISRFNKYMLRYSVLFEYARTHGYIPENFFKGFTIDEDSDDDEERAIFTVEQLELLFKKLNSNNKLHSYYYWAPRIALFSGMRQNEICQIYLDDIKEQSGTYYIDINKRKYDNHLKTNTSRRWLPIHSKLIEMGLIDRVLELRARGEERLFPELKYNGTNYSKSVSNWFSRVRSTLGWVNLEPKLDFHSFRHNVATALQENDVPESHVNAILGHAAATESFKRYGKGFKMETIKADLDAIIFDIPEIHVLPPEYKR